MTLRYYSVFGVTLESDFDFDVLETAAPSNDASLLRVIHTRGIRPVDPLPVDPYFDIQPDRQFMHWNAVGTFCIVDAQTVQIEPSDGVSDHLISQAFLGLVMSLVLERRGVLCLHASAVSVNNRAVIFLGDKGAGKSTTSGALLMRGHVPITDDLVAVGDLGTEPAMPTVRPGFASMKLWPDSVDALALDADASDRMIHPSVAKVQKRMPAEIAPQPVAMGALMVLRRDAECARPQAIRKPSHEALQVVLRFTFMARYGETRLGREHLAQHMKRCAAVVANVPVYELMFPADLSRLTEVAEAIEMLMIDGSQGRG